VNQSASLQSVVVAIGLFQMRSVHEGDLTRSGINVAPWDLGFSMLSDGFCRGCCCGGHDRPVEVESRGATKGV
jgi:hypothetical protein